MDTPETESRLASALAGRYRLERELGQGGMATVYLAEDLRHRRQVAIKVLRPDLSAALGPDRFIQEIEIAARLQHPHILGSTIRARPKASSTTSCRTSTASRCASASSRRASFRCTKRCGSSEVADALAYAHGRGVVHRDIKPDNVMLSGRHALVMDFGVAKAVNEATGRQTLTTLGVALGTPAYMAPEQAAPTRISTIGSTSTRWA